MNVNSANASMGSQGMGSMGGADKASGGGQQEQMMAKLKDAGISKDQVMAAKAKGGDAVEELFRGTGITPPSQAKGGGSSQAAAAPEGSQKMDLSSILDQLEEAGGTEDELNTAMESGPDAVQSLFEEYSLSIDTLV